MLAIIRGFKDPWEQPLKKLPPDRMKKFSDREKEARLLVAAWQGNTNELDRLDKSGKPEPRFNACEMPSIETQVKFHGKAFRAETWNRRAQRSRTRSLSGSSPQRK